MWVLETKPESFARLASALNRRAASLASISCLPPILEADLGNIGNLMTSPELSAEARLVSAGRVLLVATERHGLGKVYVRMQIICLMAMAMRLRC